MGDAQAVEVSSAREGGQSMSTKSIRLVQGQGIAQAVLTAAQADQLDFGNRLRSRLAGITSKPPDLRAHPCPATA